MRFFRVCAASGAPDAELDSSVSQTSKELQLPPELPSPIQLHEVLQSLSSGAPDAELDSSVCCMLFRNLHRREIILISHHSHSPLHE